MRSMPSGKDKYRGIERALRQLQKEGWPIIKETDNHSVAWYSLDQSFGEFIVKRLNDVVERIKKEAVLREANRLNDVLEMEYRLGIDS